LKVASKIDPLGLLIRYIFAKHFNLASLKQPKQIGRTFNDKASSSSSDGATNGEVLDLQDKINQTHQGVKGLVSISFGAEKLKKQQQLLAVLKDKSPKRATTSMQANKNIHQRANLNKSLTIKAGLVTTVQNNGIDRISPLE
jgi:hypothetical protein